MIVVIASDERLTRRVLQTLADLDRRTVSVASCAEVDHLSRTRAHACIYVTTELTAAAVTEMVDLQRRERCPPLIIVTRQAEVSANLAGLRVHALVSSGRLGSLPDVVRELRTSQTMAERLRQAISRLPSIDPVLVAPLIDMTRPKELRRIEALRKSELISKQRLRDALGMSATWLYGRLKAAFGGIAKPWGHVGGCGARRARHRCPGGKRRRYAGGHRARACHHRQDPEGQPATDHRAEELH